MQHPALINRALIGTAKALGPVPSAWHVCGEMSVLGRMPFDGPPLARERN
jgi:hypothetical protein